MPDTRKRGRIPFGGTKSPEIKESSWKQPPFFINAVFAALLLSATSAAVAFDVAVPGVGHGSGIFAGGPAVVFVVPTFERNFAPRVLPGRITWRARAPTVIVTNGTEERFLGRPRQWYATEHEVWYEFPDDPANDTHPPPTRASDTRCIAALRLANDSYPQAHWYAYGDDDTQARAHWKRMGASPLTGDTQPRRQPSPRCCFSHSQPTQEQATPN